jgi:hypothetical protein
VKNDPSSPLTRFCLGLEKFRRTPDGRVRNADELVAHFFPCDDTICADQLFKHMPRDVRAPILAGWRIRGLKSALADSDAKIEEVVADSLRAGDIGPEDFEAAITPELLTHHVPLNEWWVFWRTGRLSPSIVTRAVLIAHDLAVFDASWFLETLVAADGHTRGIDAVAPRLAKAELVAWIRRVYESGDASPEGIVRALGWEPMLTSCTTSSLLLVLDALVKKVGLLVDLPSALARVDDLETSWGEPKAQA